MQPKFSLFFAQEPAACPRADPAQSSPPTVPVNLTVHVTPQLHVLTLQFIHYFS